MPIERQAIMSEDMPMEEPTEEVAEETVSLPMTILGGKSVAAGDVVRLEVVSVDEDGGNVTVKYATESEAPAAEEPMGVEGMAAEFD